MMSSRFSRAHKAAAMILVLALMNLYVGTALAASARPQASGKLTTTGNQPVLVNGNSAANGATILTGATIETGDQVGATIDLGPLGTVDIAPNTKIKIEFDNGQMKITLIEGCVIVKPKQGKQGEIFTEDGKEITHNDHQTKPAAVLDVCFPKGAPGPIVNQGAAANAGAGAGGGGVGDGLAWGLGGGIAGGIILTVILLTRGDDPSPSS